MVAIFSFSAFWVRSLLVMSVTSASAFAAFAEFSRPSASTIWFFHRGMVLTIVDWIFSTIMVSLFWIMRICGPVCRATMRVSSRSWIFFSKRRH